jgi:hypothetical protein
MKSPMLNVFQKRVALTSASALLALTLFVVFQTSSRVAAASPNDHVIVVSSTIQAAVDAAQPGRVEICSGISRERKTAGPITSLELPSQRCQLACESLEVELQRSFKAATPGNSLPARNSNVAPPPVEMCVMRSATPARLTAATESPPPTTTMAPRSAASATA